MDEQTILLKIVETWSPSEKPEYRGFRCANCQQYKNEGWYHWLNSDGYKLPVHLCNDCELAFQNDSFQIDESKRQSVNRDTFTNTYSDKAVEKFKEIVAAWPDNKETESKAFTCDDCGKELEIDASDGLRKGYHVWWKMDDNTLAELHFDKDCAQKFTLILA